MSESTCCRLQKSQAAKEKFVLLPYTSFAYLTETFSITNVETGSIIQFFSSGSRSIFQATCICNAYHDAWWTDLWFGRYWRGPEHISCIILQYAGYVATCVLYKPIDRVLYFDMAACCLYFHWWSPTKGSIGPRGFKFRTVILST